jgi:hypothetical protein
VEPGSGPAEAPTPVVAAVPRQRWRLVLSRDAGSEARTGRDLIAAWEAALDASGLPILRPIGKSRARIALGAPVPAAIALERELADIVVTELCPAWLVREALSRAVPDGWHLIDIEDVWLGAPPLAGQVSAADYRMELGSADAAVIAQAAAEVLASTSLPRERLKGGAPVPYDLRPLLVDVVVADAGPPLVLRTRTRFDPVLGTGRAEEVVAAVGEAGGLELVIGTMVRERLILAAQIRLRGKVQQAGKSLAERSGDGRHSACGCGVSGGGGVCEGEGREGADGIGRKGKKDLPQRHRRKAWKKE